jgi:hypothetical protein
MGSIQLALLADLAMDLESNIVEKELVACQRGVVAIGVE